MRLTRAKLPLAGAAAVLALTGCGSGGGDEEAAPETAVGSLEQLAAEVKCEPNMQIDADELRQALCEDGDERYILATFATDRGQREWLNSSKMMGGFFLVGRKWAAVGHEDLVNKLGERLGGTVEIGTDHSKH
ncbi:hypothetical protein [Streptomyces sp. NPDC002845]